MCVFFLYLYYSSPGLWARNGALMQKIAIFTWPMSRFDRLLRLTNTRKELEFTRCVVPLCDRMFRYAQSLLLCADEAEDVTHDLLERLWTGRMQPDCHGFPGRPCSLLGRIDKFI